VWLASRPEYLRLDTRFEVAAVRDGRVARVPLEL
jgi:hypothetical protein